MKANKGVTSVTIEADAVENVLENEEAKPNRMERRRLKTRAKLLSATLDLIVKKGVEKTTMDDITEKADLGRRTLYYHFSSKDECIVTAVAEVFLKHASKGANIVAEMDDPARVIATAVQVVPRALLSEPVTTQLVKQPKLLAASLTEAVETFFHHDMDRGFHEGRFSNPIRGPMLDNMMLWSLVGMLIELVENHIDIDQAVKDYAHIYLIMLGIDGEEAQVIVSETAKQLS